MFIAALCTTARTWKHPGWNESFKGLDIFFLFPCSPKVYIRIKDDEWNVYRRYAEFRTLHHKLQNKYPQVRAFNFPPKKAIGNKVGGTTAVGWAALRLVPLSSPSAGDLNIWAPLCNSKSWLIQEKRWERSKQPPTIHPPKDSRVTSCLRVQPLISLEWGCHTCSAKRPQSKCLGSAAPITSARIPSAAIMAAAADSMCAREHPCVPGKLDLLEEVAAGSGLWDIVSQLLFWTKKKKTVFWFSSMVVLIFIWT